MVKNESTIFLISLLHSLTINILNSYKGHSGEKSLLSILDNYKFHSDTIQADSI